MICNTVDSKQKGTQNRSLWNTEMTSITPVETIITVCISYIYNTALTTNVNMSLCRQQLVTTRCFSRWSTRHTIWGCDELIGSLREFTYHNCFVGKLNEWKWMKKIYIARLKAYKCMLNLPRLAENWKTTKTKPMSKSGVPHVEKNGL